MLTRIDTPQGRQYKCGDKYYPSITTVLGKTKDVESLEAWRESVGSDVADYIMRSAAEIGTETHNMLEAYLQGRDPYTPLPSLLAQSHFKNLKKYTRKISAIRGLEIKLYSDELGVAGTADCVAHYNGILSIIDYKTKRKTQSIDWLEDYFLQTAAYATMWAEHMAEEVQQTVILVSSEDGMSQEIIRHPYNYMDKLRERIQRYKEL